jgi:hypothetical protein
MATKQKAKAKVAPKRKPTKTKATKATKATKGKGGKKK